MKALLNPNRFRPGYAKDKAAGRKAYYPRLVYPNGNDIVRMRQFKTATDALDYFVRLIVRWIRLYNAALAAMVTSEPESGPA